jgi:hypothetical protein
VGGGSSPFSSYPHLLHLLGFSSCTVSHSSTAYSFRSAFPLATVSFNGFLFAFPFLSALTPNPFFDGGIDEFFEFLFSLSSSSSILCFVSFLSSSKIFNTCLMLSGVISKSLNGTFIPPSSISSIMLSNLPYLLLCDP